MSVKDIILVGLILFAGLFFYWRGLETGMRRTRRLFERYLGDPKAFTELPPADSGHPSSPKGAASVHVRGGRAVFSENALHGIFGKN